ncbi:MAG: preprotein translocase subunit SecY [Oscillospiraceae bacterium]|jgi:preprotein translocase subunit SecY|nr:preprotein translocase subunit SecY [Oscillospiraceae bacterium]
MLSALRQAWKSGDLKKRLLYTLLIIVVFRVGSIIPVPFLDVRALQGFMGNLADGGAILAYFDTLSGGAFAQATLFAMSVQPYINSSIIMQLMSVAIPVLETLQREGEEGRKKITAITRVLTIFLGISQGFAYYVFLRNHTYGGTPIVKYVNGTEGVFAAFVIVSVFTAGTALMMWLGERINEKGIGNGVSILMFAGIVSRMPSLITRMIGYVYLAIENPEKYWFYYIFVPLFILIFLGMMWLIVFMNDAERRIPIQYAKRIIGRRMFDGQSSHLPLKIGLAGVMPIIFAGSILGLPSMINLFARPTGIMKAILDALSVNGIIYIVVYFALILMFAYFYVSISYNPIEIANNLRQSGGAVPGIRPGKPTSEYLSKVLSKVTLMGALFLAFIAIFPMFFAGLTPMGGLSTSGTSIVILVGVALETAKMIESQTMMRQYKGFLD